MAKRGWGLHQPPGPEDWVLGGSGVQSGNRHAIHDDERTVDA